MGLPTELQVALDEARQLVAKRETGGAEAALEALIEARKRFAEEVLNEYAAEYQAAMNTVLPVLRRGFVLQATLGIFLPGLFCACIADLCDPAKVLFYLYDLRKVVQSSGWQNLFGPGGYNDPQALALYQELAPIREAIQGLERVTGKESEGSAPTEPFSPGAYKYVGISGGCAITRL